MADPNDISTDGEGTPMVKAARKKLTGSAKATRQQQLDEAEEAAGSHSSEVDSATSGMPGQSSDAYNKY